jgi:hypothetical protein
MKPRPRAEIASGSIGRRTECGARSLSVRPAAAVSVGRPKKNFMKSFLARGKKNQ